MMAFLSKAVCLFLLIDHCTAQLVPRFNDDLSTPPDSKLKKVVTLENLNQCYAAGIENARSRFVVKYPVVHKRNLSDAPVVENDVSGEAKPRARDAGYYGALVEGMVRCLTALYELTVEEVEELVHIELNQKSLLGESCLIPEEETIGVELHMISSDRPPMDKIVESMLDTTNPCVLYPFRTITGYCNNLRRPDWGMSFRPFRRLLPPDYDDGISVPRQTSRITGASLPNPRLVSNAVHNTHLKTQHHIATHMVMQWAQVLDHDFTHTPQTTNSDGKIAKCCGETPPNRNPECFVIPVPEGDFFAQHNKTCLEFVRSMPTARAGCRLGPREQINQLTSYLDGSVIYGSTEAEANFLRSFQDGLLRAIESGPHAQHGAGTNLLPLDLFHQDCLNFFKPEKRECFHAGDLRVNEQTGLSSMHLVLTREHNRVAVELKRLNPHWQDERLFQEARKIVGAEEQFITYKVWLPLVVGPTTMRNFRLNLLPAGYSYDYNASQDATIPNVFGAAAFRFGHTLIQGAFELFSDRNRLVGKMNLIDMFNQPYHLYVQGRMDEFLKGLVVQRAQVFDRHIDNQVMDHLFEEPPGVDGKGQDLIARNVQRARDHGIPPYVEWRRICQLVVPKNFDHLRELDIIDPETVNIMESLYDSVNDIDVFPGLMSERSLPDAIVGPTTACIFGHVFGRIKHGDRFWFENGLNLPNAFTLEQLVEIRKSSLARILCDGNNGGIRHIQPNVFLDPHTTADNRVVPCSDIPEMNLSPWIENPNDKDAILTINTAMLRKPHTAEEDSVQVLFRKKPKQEAAVNNQTNPLTNETVGNLFSTSGGSY